MVLLIKRLSVQCDSWYKPRLTSSTVFFLQQPLSHWDRLKYLAHLPISFLHSSFPFTISRILVCDNLAPHFLDNTRYMARLSLLKLIYLQKQTKEHHNKIEYVLLKISYLQVYKLIPFIRTIFQRCLKSLLRTV